MDAEAQAFQQDKEQALLRGYFLPTLYAYYIHKVRAVTAAWWTR